MSQLKRILLIDDDFVTNFINENLINEMGIAEEIICLKNGKEAIDFFRNRDAEQLPIDIVFLDLNMPVMDGFQFMEAYHQLDEKSNSKVIVAMLTSSTIEKEKEIADKLGVQEHLNKPLTREKINQLLLKYYS
jgi:CheY-like chemotaxis protein